MLLAGQKSGDLWAVNPDNGSLLWNQRIGQGITLGGNHWGIATDGETPSNVLLAFKPK